MNVEHVRALAITIAPHHKLELSLKRCRISDIDACRNVFVQGMQSGGGPTELHEYDINSHVLADSLKGNSRLGFSVYLLEIQINDVYI
jgi:hypothetical protein